MMHNVSIWRMIDQQPSLVSSIIDQFLQIMPQQQFRTCFRWSVSFIFWQYASYWRRPQIE